MTAPAKPKKEKPPTPLVEDVILSQLVTLGRDERENLRYYSSPGFGEFVSSSEEAQFEADAGTKRFVPPARMVPKVNLPAAPAKCADTAALFEAVKQFFLKRLDFEESAARACAAYVFYTWTGDNLSVTPVLFVLGDYGAGKSRLLQIMWRLSCRGFRCSLNTSFAAARNVISRWKTTLVLDEGTIKGKVSEKSEEWIRAICDSTSDPSGVILIASKDEAGETHAFFMGGPKIISSTREWPDQGFARRCVMITMLTTARNFRRLNMTDDREADALAAQLHGLRHRLLGHRTSDPASVEDEVNDDLYARGLRAGSKQFSTPLAAVLKVFAPAEYEALVDDAIARAADAVETAAESLEGRIIGHLFAVRRDLVGETPGEFSPSEIAAALSRDDDEVRPFVVGKILKKMGFTLHHTNAGNLWAFPPSKNDGTDPFEALCRKYVPSFEPAKSGRSPFHKWKETPPEKSPMPADQKVKGVKGVEGSPVLRVGAREEALSLAMKERPEGAPPERRGGRE